MRENICSFDFCADRPFNRFALELWGSVLIWLELLPPTHHCSASAWPLILKETIFLFVIFLTELSKNLQTCAEVCSKCLVIAFFVLWVRPGSIEMKKSQPHQTCAHNLFCHSCTKLFTHSLLLINGFIQFMSAFAETLISLRTSTIQDVSTCPTRQHVHPLPPTPKTL